MSAPARPADGAGVSETSEVREDQWPCTIVFGDCTLDTQRYELRRGGVRLPLRRKVFQVLVYLLEQRDRVVSRDEVLAQVWPDQYVGEETLTSCVKAVRRAVGDNGRAQRVIQTVHGHGLRFVAEVTVAETAPAPGPAPAPALPLAPACPAAELLVGREAELTTLHRWYATARQGTRQVGFITGEAGVGKTALVEAFVAQVAAEGAVWIGHGQCIDQYGTGEAYLPVLEALGRLCRGPQGAHFLAWLRQQAPSWLAQMPAVLPVAEREAILRLAGDATQARMLRELAEALEVLTAERPLLLVLEDLHWSDGATLEWLAYVARRRDPGAAPGARHVSPGRGAGRRPTPVDALVQDLLVRHQGAELVLVGALSVPAVATVCHPALWGGGARGAAWPRCCTSARRAIPCSWSRWWRICNSAAWCGPVRTAGNSRRPWTPPRWACRRRCGT